MSLFFRRHSPIILSCLGAAGTVATAILAAKATPKAMDLLNKASDEKGEELTTLEAFCVAGPVYVPAALASLSTIACIFGANVLNKKTQASLISAYAMLDRIHKEYKDKLVELSGEEANLSIQKAIVEDKVKEEEIESPKNKLVFYEEHYGRFFERTIEEVLTAEYHFNRNFALRSYAVLNEFYDFLGLPRTAEGDVLGWSMDAGAELYGYSWVDFEHRSYETEDGLTVYDIVMPFSPTADYLDEL